MWIGQYNIQDTKQKCFIVTIFLHLALFYVHYCNINTITKSKNFQTSLLLDLIYKSALHYSIIQVISQASLAQAYFIVELLWCHWRNQDPKQTRNHSFTWYSTWARQDGLHHVFQFDINTNWRWGGNILCIFTSMNHICSDIKFTWYSIWSLFKEAAWYSDLN